MQIAETINNAIITHFSPKYVIAQYLAFLVFLSLFLSVVSMQVAACYMPGGWPANPTYQCNILPCRMHEYRGTFESQRLEEVNIGVFSDEWRLLQDADNHTPEFDGSYLNWVFFEQPENTGHEPQHIASGVSQRYYYNSEHITHTKSGVSGDVSFAFNVGAIGVARVGILAYDVAQYWQHYMIGQQDAFYSGVGFWLEPGQMAYVDYVYKYRYHRHKQQRANVYKYWQYLPVPGECGPLTDSGLCWRDLTESTIVAEKIWNLTHNSAGWDFDYYPMCSSPIIFDVLDGEPECPD